MTLPDTVRLALSRGGPAHAAVDGEVLCGALADVTERSFPDGEAYCRDCMRAAYRLGSDVPMGGSGKKRPGGM